MEIERKFTIKELPKDLDSYECLEMEQGYLCTDPVVRARKENDTYYLTYKGRGLLAREEANLPLTKEGYEHLIQKADGLIIKKKRYIIPLAGSYSHLKIELDVFEMPRGLIMAEVEFPSVEEANAFVPPTWFDEDVTSNRAYHNSNMSRGKEEFSPIA